MTWSISSRGEGEAPSQPAFVSTEQLGCCYDLRNRPAGDGAVQLCVLEEEQSRKLQENG